MADLITAKYNTLKGYGYTGALQDAYWRYLLSETGSTSGAIQDLERKLFLSMGYSGSIQDMWYDYLKASGYTGALQDILHSGHLSLRA